MNRKVPGGRLLLAGLALALVQGTASAAEPNEIDGFASPEAVVSDGKHIYVSNVGEKLDPTAKDGDGFISKLALDGSVVERRFLPAKGAALDAPKGMAINDGVLYVADIDRIVGFELASGKQVYSADLSANATVFLNDLTFGEGNTLYVSATDLGRIFALDVTDKSGKARALDLPPLPGPNGLKYDKAGKRLLVAGFGTDNKPTGEIGVITELETKPVYKKLTEAKGYFDGIALIGPDRLLTSDWVAFEKKGVLKTVDMRTGQVAEHLADTPIGGPAAFMVDTSAGRVWLPAMMEGKVKVLPLPSSN